MEMIEMPIKGWMNKDGTVHFYDDQELAALKASGKGTKLVPRSELDPEYSEEQIKQLYALHSNWPENLLR
jgi:hypothetical protein